MKTLKLLYIDKPFIGIDSGDKNRSKFLYKTLLDKYNTDVLLVQDKEYKYEYICSHKHNNKVFILNTKKQKCYKSSAILDFYSKELNSLKALILENDYDICFLRMATMGNLAKFIKQHFPKIKIIIDVDMLFSQISKVAWSLDKSFKNRYHLFEYYKLYLYEREFFNKEYTFLYTNEKELSLVKHKYKVLNEENHHVLANVINDIKIKSNLNIDEKFILFYGILNSTANLSAYKYIVETIYPKIEHYLKLKNIKIYIVGKNQTKIHQNPPSFIRLIGEVDDIASYIKQSLLVIFPLTVASGTLTRILEVVNMKKSIVASKVASSGLYLEDKIFISDNEVQMSRDIIKLIENDSLKSKYEQLAYEFVKEKYSLKSVQNSLYSIIKKAFNKTNIIHIPRRFTKTHWGGTENVVIGLANGLKKFNIQSEVVTTNILDSKKEDIINGIKVKRFSYFYPYFNLSTASKKNLDLVGGNLFSWSLLKYLFLLKKVDLIHLHTAKRLGSIARTVCLMRNIPYIITVHGGLYDISLSEKKTRMEPTKDSFEWGKLLGFIFGSRKVYDDASAIITLSKSEYDNTKKNYPNKNVYLLTNSIDVKSFQIKKDYSFRQRHNIKDDLFVFLSSGRIDRQKNQLLTIKAFEKILEESSKTHLLLVGNITDQSYYDEIKAYISMKKLNSNITLLTNLKPKSKELISAYLNSNAFILSSRHEPFGIVALEAWASKLPLIISNICGICNLVENNKTALIFEDNKLNDLIEKMQLLLKNTSLYDSLAQNASFEVLKYDDKEVNKTLVKIYQNTIKNK